MRYILMSFLFLLQFGRTFSQEAGWKFAVSGENGDQKVYIKSEYVSKKDGYIKVWVKTVYKTFTSENKVYKDISIKALTLFDCKGKRTKNIQAYAYDASGNIFKSNIYSGNVSAEDWDDVVPESVAEGVLILACQMFN